jgi:hypothetical protein
MASFEAQLSIAASSLLDCSPLLDRVAFFAASSLLDCSSLRLLCLTALFS